MIGSHTGGLTARFVFPNSKRLDKDAITAAFKEQGMEIAEIQWELACWTWVLTTTGHLYCHDTSHGGGGVFTLESKAK